MKQQYDLFADKYDIQLNSTPYRPHVEAYSFFKILGSVENLRVLDLATGTGYYARACAKLGAKDVVGIDLSKEMIEIARQAEADTPYNIRYEVADATQFSDQDPFDIVIAVYLLHYAPSYEDLQTMCHSIASNLKSGARFVAYQLNPELSRVEGYYAAYGLSMTSTSSFEDGEKLIMKIKLAGIETPDISVYRWNQETIETCLKEAGFKSIQWHQPELSPRFSETDYPADFFDVYLEQPHAVLFEATKS